MKYETPFSQLFKLLQTQEQKDILIESLQPLLPAYRDDLCLAIIAYIRFGIRRPYTNKFMWALFESYCYLLDNANC